jgi:hypothetical protein
MHASTIFYPVVAMVILGFIAVCLSVRERVFEFKSRKIHPQKLPSSSQMLAVLVLFGLWAVFVFQLLNKA